METETTHEEKGIELRKYYEEAEYSLPSVVFQFSSNRPEPVSVRLVEPIPDELDPDHIGFSEGEAGENWKLRKTELILECTLTSAGEYETVYALRPEQSYDPDSVVVEPEVFEVNALETEPDSSGDFLRSASGKEDKNGAKDQSVSSSETVRESDDDEQPLQELQFAQSTSERSDSMDDTNGSLIDQLATELELGSGSEESRTVLKEELGVTDESGSTDARIRQLQADLSDFRAYKTALKEFLDDNGSARELINDFEAQIESFDEELTSVKADVRAQNDAIDAVRNENKQIRSELDSATSEIQSLTQSVDELNEELSSLDSRVPEYDVGEHMSEIEEQVTELSTFMNDLRSVFGQDDA